MNFRITYLHNILYIKKERKGKKKKRREKINKNSDNIVYIRLYYQFDLTFNFF